MFSFAVRAGMFGGGLIGVHWYGMSLYDKVAGRQEAKFRPDTTTARVSVRSQVPESIKLEYRDEDGERKVAVVDEHRYKAEVVRQAVALEQGREKLQERALSLLRDELDGTFSEVAARTTRFADWYFSYLTGYMLIAKAAASAATHLISLSRSQSVEELVGEDLRQLLQQHWESIVLRPEITDARLQRGWALTVREAHREYLDLLEKQQRQLRRFVAENTSHARAPGSADVSLSLDWSAQLDKSNSLSANFQRSPVQTVALITGGGVAGKAVAATGGKAAGGLFAKLSSPFAAKGVATAGSAGAGAGLGAVAGPVGAGVGAAVGIGIDFGINKGIELMRREEFEQDCREAVQATREEWEERASDELKRVVDVWLTDAIQLLPVQDPAKSSRGWFSSA